MSPADTQVATVATATATDRRGAFVRLTASEIGMVFRRRRNLALLAAFAATPVAIGIAVRAAAPQRGGDGPQFLNQVSGNGLFLVFTTLTVTVPLLIPLLISVVAGDAIAGEAGTGTLRYLLTVPVTRSRLITVKAVAVVTYIAAGVVAVAVIGTATGAILFGLHGPTLLSGDTVSLAAGLGRTAEMAGYIILSVTGLIAIGMFITTLTEVPIAAMAATLGVAILATVLDAVPQLGSLRHLMFVDHWIAFTDILRLQVDWATLWRDLLLQLGYVVVFGSAAWARFASSDVTS